MATSLEGLKNKAFAQLKDAMLSALESGKMTILESEESARYISFHLTPVEGTEELLLFFEDLTEKWKAYKDVQLNFQRELAQEEEKVKLTEAESKLEKMKDKQS